MLQSLINRGHQSFTVEVQKSLLFYVSDRFLKGYCMSNRITCKATLYFNHVNQDGNCFKRLKKQ